MFNPPTSLQCVLITVESLGESRKIHVMTALKYKRWVMTSMTSLFTIFPSYFKNVYHNWPALKIFALSPSDKTSCQLEIIHTWQCGYLSDFIQNLNLTNLNIPCHYDVDWIALFHEVHPRLELMSIYPEEIEDGIKNFLPTNDQLISTGMKILVEACTFTTMLAFSSGIVASTFCHGCVFMIDTYMRLNSEGSPIYSTGEEGDHICGMIVCSQPERNSYPVCVSLSHIVAEGLRSVNAALPARPAMEGWNLEDNGPPVVKVEFEDSCGTGTLIHPMGLIATCAHVVKFEKSGTVQLISNGCFIDGEIIFSSKISDPLDIAFIKTSAKFPFLRPIDEQESDPEIGDLIFTKGINPSSWHTYLHSGIVSNFTDEFSPIYVDAKTISGNSGGAVMKENGALLGIILGNLVDLRNDNSPSYLTLCIPVKLLVNAINSFDLHGEIRNDINADMSPYHNTIWNLSLEGVNLR